MSSDPDGEVEIFFDDRWNQIIDQGNATIEQRYGADMQYRCDLSDPSCVIGRSRTMEPVAEMGGYIYVLEYERVLAEYGELLSATWDEKLMQWVDAAGEPIDVTTYKSWIPPRLNAYYTYDFSWIE